jgi:hypothetical protein
MRQVFYSQIVAGRDRIQFGLSDAGQPEIFNVSKGRRLAELQPWEMAAELERIGRERLTHAGLTWLLKAIEKEARPARPVDLVPLPTDGGLLSELGQRAIRKRRMGRKALTPRP